MTSLITSISNFFNPGKKRMATVDDALDQESKRTRLDLSVSSGDSPLPATPTPATRTIAQRVEFSKLMRGKGPETHLPGPLTLPRLLEAARTPPAFSFSSGTNAHPPLLPSPPPSNPSSSATSTTAVPPRPRTEPTIFAFPSFNAPMAPTSLPSSSSFTQIRDSLSSQSSSRSNTPLLSRASSFASFASSPQPRERAYLRSRQTTIGTPHRIVKRPVATPASRMKEQINSMHESAMRAFEAKRAASSPAAQAQAHPESFWQLQRLLDQLRPDTELEEPEPELKLEPLSLKASLTKTKTPLNDMSALRRTLSISKKTLESPRPPAPYLPSRDKLRVEDEELDRLVEKRLAKKVVEKLPTSLSQEESAEVDALLAKPNHVSRCVRAEVRHHDLVRLKPCEWLNDEIINYYGQMITDACEARLARAKAQGGGSGTVVGAGEALSVHYFSTFFFQKLSEQGYAKSRLARWTKKTDIFSKDAILIPINKGNAHWTSAVINMRMKRIEAYDSMGHGSAKHITKILREYLNEESLDKRKKPFDFTGWVEYSDPDLTPQQLNGFDCGVFTCQILEACSRGGGAGVWTFGQGDMPYLRRRMMLEIGRAKLLNNPGPLSP